MSPLTEWGAPGIIIITLATYYAIKDRAHQKEREALEKSHREEREKMMHTLNNITENSNKTLTNIADNSNKAIYSVGNAVTEISTLIKSNRK